MHAPVLTFSPPAMASPGGHYSHVAVAAGLVFVAGQLPITPEGHRLTSAPFEAQALQVLSNVRNALEAAGSGVARLVQVRVYLTDFGHWPAFNTLYAAWAGEHRPARGGAGAGAAPRFAAESGGRGRAALSGTAPNHGNGA